MLSKRLALTLLSLLLWTPALAQVPAAPDPAQVPNFHRVAPNFYRSGQPTVAGFQQLVERYGIRTVISLRQVGRDSHVTIGLPVRLYRYGISPGQVARDRAQVVAALRTLRVAVRQGPTLLHCEHGSDRTGMVTALYRILYEDVGKADALREMRDKAFGFHTVWKNIPRFIQEVDVTKLKREVGEL